MAKINKKSQAGPIAFVVLIIIFLIVLSAMGGTLWGLWGEAGANAGLTGIEAFVYDNPFFIVLIALVLGIIGWVYFGT